MKPIVFCLISYPICWITSRNREKKSFDFEIFFRIRNREKNFNHKRKSFLIFSKALELHNLLIFISKFEKNICKKGFISKNKYFNNKKREKFILKNFSKSFLSETKLLSFSIALHIVRHQKYCFQSMIKQLKRDMSDTRKMRQV